MRVTRQDAAQKVKQNLGNIPFAKRNIGGGETGLGNIAK
jgi:hypothetical protein